MAADADTLRFEPWQSAVDPGFWAELARRKGENRYAEDLYNILRRLRMGC